MVARLHHRAAHYAILGAAAAILFLWNLGGASLWDLDEGRNSTCAAEMRDAGDFVVPRLNGDLRVDKPALLYWLQIIAYDWFGVNEFAARLPSALAAWLAVLLAYELGRAMFGKATGLLGGLIAATSPMLCGAARFANPDALLHLCTVATLLIFWLGHRQPSLMWWLALGCVTGLGMLAKGPVGLVLPGAAALVFLTWEGRLRLLRDRRIAWAALTWCLVALPWYALVGVETKGAFLRGFFLEHNAGRFSATMESHSGGIFYYPIVLVVGTAPWSIFAGATLWCAAWSAMRGGTAGAAAPDEASLARRWWTRAADREMVGHPEIAPPPATAYRFLLTWLATYVIFFTAAATKLPNYVLPVVVPCSLLTARLLERWRRDRLALPSWVFLTALASLALMGVGLGVGLHVAGGGGDWPSLRQRVIPALAPWAWLGVAPLAGAAIALGLWRHQCRGALIACVAVTSFALVAPLAVWGAATLDEVKAIRALVEAAQARQRDVDMRIVAWQLEHLPSLNFYTQRDVVHVQSEAELAALLRYPLPVFAFLPAHAWDGCDAATRDLGRELARRRDFYKARDVVVVTNQ